MNSIMEVALPIFITKFEEHETVKETLLNLIGEMPNESIKHKDSITKTDWNLSLDYPRPYLDFIKPKLIDCVSNTLSKYGYPAIAFNRFWYQQYHNSDVHNWHVHSSCHYTNVYYISLPDKTFKTEIQTWDRSKSITYNVQEGDIITFPSMLYHRSPVNYSSQIKTIISFNLDLLSSTDSRYV